MHPRSRELSPNSIDLLVDRRHPYPLRSGQEDGYTPTAAALSRCPASTFTLEQVELAPGQSSFARHAITTREGVVVLRDVDLVTAAPRAYAAGEAIKRSSISDNPRGVLAGRHHVPIEEARSFQPRLSR